MGYPQKRLIAFFLCLAVMIAVFSSQPPYSPQQFSYPKTTSAPKNDIAEETPEHAIARYNYWLTWVTFILAVATAGLGGIGIFQIRLAREEYISTHRPRIVLREANLIADTIHYTLVNLGGTPATIIQSWIFAEFVEDGTRWRPLWPAADDEAVFTRLTFTGGESRDLQYALPPGVSFAITFPASTRIGVENRGGLTGKVYFVGALIYEDGLGMKRRSIFRRRWDDASLTFVRLTPEQERDHEYAD